ncbi:MAG: hypothetical protein D3907_01835 [Candidatus Electrothrix sp. AUS3]|nr:hypothetical protein [Candidatus Electrothrix gigas]
MDNIISAAIISGLVSGVATDAVKIGKEAVVDAYKALMTALRKKCGSNSDVIKAVERLEKKPNSEGGKLVVAEEIKAAKVHEDTDLIAAAEILQAAVDKMQGVTKKTINLGDNANVGVMGNYAHVEGGIHLGGNKP